MREHTHLPAMVGFVRKHVAEHFRANRPRLSPAVSAKLLDAALATAERFSEHLRAASGALGQSCAGLLRRAVRAIELSWNLQVRSCKPDPLAADIVHVREDRRNGTDFAGRFGSPGGRAKMFDKNLVDAIIGGKDLDRSSAKLSLNPGPTNLVLTCSHGSLFLDPSRCSPFMVQSKEVRSLCRPSLLARDSFRVYFFLTGKRRRQRGKENRRHRPDMLHPNFQRGEHSFAVLSWLALSPL
jgi:hypothetical protein